MTASKQLLLISAGALALAAIVKSLQVAMTPETVLALTAAAKAILDNVVVKLLLAGVGAVWILSLCAWAWDRGTE